jgi:hypothetical protein
VFHFKYFQYFQPYSNDTRLLHSKTTLPYASNDFGVLSVCLMKITRDLAVALGLKLYLNSGSLLGARVHGGPVPFDDDTDALMHVEQLETMYSVCKKGDAVKAVLGFDGVRITCAFGVGGMKLSLVPGEGSWGRKAKKAGTRIPHDFPAHIYGKYESPFIDLFGYDYGTNEEGESVMVECTYRPRDKYPFGNPRCDFKLRASMIKKSSIQKALRGGINSHSGVTLTSFFFSNIENLYFGGILVPGPSIKDVYGKEMTCFFPKWNHRLEKAYDLIRIDNVMLNCCSLAAAGVPFIYSKSKKEGGFIRIVVGRGVDGGYNYMELDEFGASGASYRP